LTVAMGPGDSVWVESGAMSRMSKNMEMKTRAIGGMFKAILRRMVGGESVLVGEYTSPGVGFVALSPAAPGCVLHREMKGDSFNLTAGAFMACTPGMELKTRFGGLKAFFSGEGAFFLEASGTGDLFFNAYGGVVEKEIDGNFTVDTGHLVAWEPTLDYSIGGMGGLKQTLFSGEGLVMKFSGRGKIYLQTRYLSGMAGWLTSFCR
ncbi:MAG: TIGR00266 family protein, partial [Planctomycetales bacterium]